MKRLVILSPTANPPKKIQTKKRRVREWFSQSLGVRVIEMLQRRSSKYPLRKKTSKMLKMKEFCTDRLTVVQKTCKNFETFAKLLLPHSN